MADEVVELILQFILNICSSLVGYSGLNSNRLSFMGFACQKLLYPVMDFMNQLYG